MRDQEGKGREGKRGESGISITEDSGKQTRQEREREREHATACTRSHIHPHTHRSLSLSLSSAAVSASIMRVIATPDHVSRSQGGRDRKASERGRETAREGDL